MGSDGSPQWSRRPRSKNQQTQRRKPFDKTDAKWEEMHSSLAEVEVNAAHGMHVLSPEHEKALEGLRLAQIEIAKAWARSEADDGDEGADVAGKNFSGKKTHTSSDEKIAGTTTSSGNGRPRSAAGQRVEGDDDISKHESVPDIILARKRREANDKYFQRVNNSVLDVVARLEAVATAMRDVERESRDIWRDSDVESSKTTVNHYQRD